MSVRHYLLRTSGLSFRQFLLLSLVLHLLGGFLLYWFGDYQVELRRQDEQVATSLRATMQVRSARRVEDLQKIKELMEQSANRKPEPAAHAQAEMTKPGPDQSSEAPAQAQPEPQQLLERARQLSKAIDELDIEIKAEELTKLTGMPPEQARADVLAAQSAAELPKTAPGEPSKGAPLDAAKAPDPAAEIATLEAHARQVLAKRGEALQRKSEGVAVGAGNDGAAPRKGGQASLSAQIADFVREREEAMVAVHNEAYSGAVWRLFDQGGGDIVGVRYGQMVKGRGRMLGAGGEFANRVYLNSWYVIGPFAGNHGRGMFHNPRYPPEDAVLLDAVYRGKDGRLLKWQYINETSYPLIPRDAAEDAVYYGYTEVLVDSERDLQVWIGADDDAQVYINDRLVWRGGNIRKHGFFQALYDRPNTHKRDYNYTEGRVTVHFVKGRNEVFFKQSNGPTLQFFSMVLTLPGQR